MYEAIKVVAGREFAVIRVVAAMKVDVAAIKQDALGKAVAVIKVDAAG